MHRFELVDVFTDQPRTGNQLAVFTDAQHIPEELLQPLARELNLSETVFLSPPENGGHARIRIFNSLEELPFAGHPTLGTAVLVAAGMTGPPATVEVRLETAKGVVPVTVQLREDGLAAGWMAQPLPVRRDWAGDLDAVLRAAGAPAPIMPVQLYDNGLAHLYIVLPSIADVLAVEPDMTALRALAHGARFNFLAGTGHAYTSRMFSPFDPAFPEDPACGSAAGPLAVHLFSNGLIGPGETVTISQGEKVGRPSTLLARAAGRPDALTEVAVGGSCVRIGAGHIQLPAGHGREAAPAKNVKSRHR